MRRTGPSRRTEPSESVAHWPRGPPLGRATRERGGAGGEFQQPEAPPGPCEQAALSAACAPTAAVVCRLRPTRIRYAPRGRPDHTPRRLPPPAPTARRRRGDPAAQPHKRRKGGGAPGPLHTRTPSPPAPVCLPPPPPGVRLGPWQGRCRPQPARAAGGRCPPPPGVRLGRVAAALSGPRRPVLTAPAGPCCRSQPARASASPCRPVVPDPAGPVLAGSGRPVLPALPARADGTCRPVPLPVPTGPISQLPADPLSPIIVGLLSPVPAGLGEGQAAGARRRPGRSAGVRSA